MKKLMGILSPLLFFSLPTMSQSIQVLKNKDIYKVGDTINIKVENQSSNEIFYLIGSEIKLNGSWKEFQEDVFAGPSKVEIYRKIKRGKSVLYNIKFPGFFNNVLENNNNLLNIRFKLSYGVSFKKLNYIFSDSIQIIK
jgi:hypothetical protein